MSNLWRIGFNPNDRHMLSLGNSLVVVTAAGDLFGADVVSGQMQPVFPYTGSKMGFNPQDRFLLAMGNTLLVVTSGGEVFAADVVDRRVQRIFQLKGDVRIGFNPQDQFMSVLGKTLLVVTRTGQVFSADVLGSGTDRWLSPISQFGGASVGFNPQDRAVMALGDKLVVLTADGTAWVSTITSRPTGAHYGFAPDGSPMGQVVERSLDPPRPLTGARIGYNRWDRFRLALNNTLVVVTDDGNVFGANVTGNALGPVTQLNVPVPALTLDTANYQIDPELRTVGTDFTPAAIVDVTIRHFPGRPFDIGHSPTTNGVGEFTLFESVDRTHISADVELPDIEVTAVDRTSGRSASARTSAYPYVTVG